MKRTIKKILRLFLVFLSSFALVLCWLPAEAQANEYDGKTYTFADKIVDQQKLWAAKIYQQLEASGYEITSKISEWSSSAKEKALEYGVNVYNATGEFIDDGSTYINNVTGLVIDYTNPYVQEFIQGAENWDITDKASDTWDFYYNLYKHLYTFSDTITIDSYFDNPDAFSAEGRDNIKKYFSYKNYGLSRGSFDNISGSSVSGDFFVPLSISFYCNVYIDGGYLGPNVTGTINISQILGSETFNYSSAPFVSGNINYDSGSFSYSASNGGYGGIDSDIYRYVFTVSGGDTGDILAVSGDSVLNVVSVSGCDVSSGFIISKLDAGTIQFIVYTISPYFGSFKIHWNDYSEGGVSAPDQPIYTMPDPSDPNYETEKKNYDYFVTETDRLLDEYDIGSFMYDIRNTFDDTPWLFYPIEFYNEVATVLTDNYSDSFDFTLEEMNFSSIADGFIIPHKEFHFDPDTLPNTVKVLFRLFQWIITFSYFWALINWGRSLILRFGSDSTHIDYEDN